MSDLDDVFDQSEEAEKRDFDRQFQNYSAKFVKAGYREALQDEEANEEILQKAFDNGYKNGFQIGLSDFEKLRFKLKFVQGMYEEKKLEKGE